MPGLSSILARFKSSSPVMDQALQRVLSKNSPPSLPAGMVAPGNLDLYDRPAVKNPDGSLSSLYSSSRSEGDSSGNSPYETLVPGVTEQGKRVEPDQGWQNYQRTGRNLGTFIDVPSADRYAEQLHLDADAGRYGDAYSSEAQANAPIGTLRRVTQTPQAQGLAPLSRRVGR